MLLNCEKRRSEAKSLAAPSSNKILWSSRHTIGFFSKREDSFKRMNIASKESFCQSSTAEVVEASFEIAQMIALAKKPHNVAETLLKPCLIKAASLVIGNANSSWRAKIFLSDSTMKACTDVLADVIEFRVLEKMQALHFFCNSV